MTKNDYLAQLEKYLRKLPKTDYQEAMEYFREYFDEVGPEGEAQAIADLGSPKEAAHELIVNLLDKEVSKDRNGEEPARSSFHVMQIAILSILAAPLAIPLFIIALVSLFIIFLFLCVLIILVTALAFAGLMMGVSVLWDTFTMALFVSFPAFLLGLGLAILDFGIAILCSLGVEPLVRLVKNIFVRLAHRVSRFTSKKGVRYD